MQDILVILETFKANLELFFVNLELVKFQGFLVSTSGITKNKYLLELPEILELLEFLDFCEQSCTLHLKHVLKKTKMLN